MKEKLLGMEGHTIIREGGGVRERISLSLSLSPLLPLCIKYLDVWTHVCPVGNRLQDLFYSWQIIAATVHIHNLLFLRTSGFPMLQDDRRHQTPSPRAVCEVTTDDLQHRWLAIRWKNFLQQLWSHGAENERNQFDRKLLLKYMYNLVRVVAIWIMINLQAVKINARQEIIQEAWSK